jgi:hypothetical protein
MRLILSLCSSPSSHCGPRPTCISYSLVDWKPRLTIPKNCSRIVETQPAKPTPRSSLSQWSRSSHSGQSPPERTADTRGLRRTPNTYSRVMKYRHVAGSPGRSIIAGEAVRKLAWSSTRDAHLKPDGQLQSKEWLLAVEGYLELVRADMVTRAHLTTEFGQPVSDIPFES